MIRKFLIWLLWTFVGGLAVGSFFYLRLALDSADPQQGIAGALAVAGCCCLGWLTLRFTRRSWHATALTEVAEDELTPKSQQPKVGKFLAGLVAWVLFFGSIPLLIIGGFLISAAIDQRSFGIVVLAMLVLLVSAVLGWLWYSATQDTRTKRIQISLERPVVHIPVPPRDLPPVSGPPVYYLLTLFVLPFAALYLANHVASNGGLQREADGKQFLTTLALCLMVPAGLLVVHELGHLLMAWAMGFRPVEFNIGSGKSWLQRRIGNLDLILRFKVHQGVVYALPLSEDGYRWKRFWICAAGLLAEAIVLIVCLVLALQHQPDAERGFAAVVGCILVAHLLHSRHPRQIVMDNELLHNDAHWMRHYWNSKQINIPEEMAESWAEWVMRLLHKRKDTEKAWELLLEFEQRMPGHPKMLYVKYHFLAHEMRWEEAAAVIGAVHAGWDSVLASLPDEASRVSALDRFATLALDPHNHSEAFLMEALNAIERAILLQPEAITLLGTKGSLLVELKRETEAEPILTKVLSETKSDVDLSISSIYLGIIAKRRGNVELQRYYEHLGTENPAFETLRWLQERAKELTQAI